MTKNQPITLFYSPQTRATGAHVLLEELKVPYAMHVLNMKAGEQRQPAYLAINPKGRVPALATDQGVLTESPAILAHIAALSPPGFLAPTDPFAFARMQSFNLYLATTVHVAHAHGRRAARWSDDAAAQASMAAKVTQNMRDGFALIEADLTGEWAMGDAYTVADPYLFTFAGWLESDGVDIASFPRVQAHFERMKTRPAVQRALAAKA